MILIIYLDLLDNSFEKYNYKDPQPLIKIFGKNIIEWIIDYINLENFTNIIIIYNNELYKNIIINIFSSNKFFSKFIFSLSTEILNNIGINHENEKVLYIDTKNFYMEDISLLWDSIMSNKNVIFYSKEEIENNKNIYINIKNGLLQPGAGDTSCISPDSYTKLDKNIITGSFGFNSLHFFKKYIKYGIQSDSGFNKNLSIISIINAMINDGIEFNTIQIDNENIISLITPFHIRLFCNNFPKMNALNNNIMINKKRICFDLEDIMSHQSLFREIDYLTYLKKIGNIIIIHTTHDISEKNNIVKILVDNNILYDEIYFNKPIADFYIDSKSELLNNNLEKQLGFYNNKIDSRDFNDIICKDIKTYKKVSNDLSGEIYYYLNIPKEIKDIFPVMFNYDMSNKWYEMENINGIPIISATAIISSLPISFPGAIPNFRRSSPFMGNGLIVSENNFSRLVVNK